MMSDRIDRMVTKFRDVLAETERLPAHKLRAYQENLLEPLVLHARRNVPFYRSWLAPLFNGEKVDLTRWEEVPILTRAEAQHNTQALTAEAVPPHAGPVETGETSGSTGRPLRYLVNDLAKVASLANTDRALRWWDFDGAKTMATLVARKPGSVSGPDGTTVTGWRVGFPGLHRMLEVSVDIDRQIDWFLAHRPHYLTAHSFTLLGLAEQARARKADLRFERINSTSTVLSDDIRDICKQAFGVGPIDQYGARETGLIACECPWCNLYHINTETLLVEILDSNGKPCPPGATGRVVLTTFYNYAMPLIRYEIGDFAIAGPARVKCPLKLPTLAQIMGRYRNSFRLSDGRTIYPFVPVARLREFISFQQFQIVQVDYDLIEVRYVPLDASRQVDADGLEACLRERIDPSVKVRAVSLDAIPRSTSGKFEDYLSLVPSRRG
jgi:phenylacetate-CoA ligase